MKRPATFAACLALAACVACGGNKQDNAVDRAQQRGDETAAGDLRSTRENNSNSHQAVTLEGCLQEGGGTFSQGFLLTEVNSPSAVGTAGSVTASGSAVEREQMRMAATTYRLDPKGDVKLSDMLGKRVRVNGTIAEQADLPNGKGKIGSDADTQVPNRESSSQRDRDSKLEFSDLAKVDVTSASVTGDSCHAPAR